MRIGCFCFHYLHPCAWLQSCLIRIHNNHIYVYIVKSGSYNIIRRWIPIAYQDSPKGADRINPAGDTCIAKTFLIRLRIHPNCRQMEQVCGGRRSAAAICSPMWMQLPWSVLYRPTYWSHQLLNSQQSKFCDDLSSFQNNYGASAVS